MKKLIVFLCMLVACLTLSACDQPCEHEWKDATCDTPKTCSACGETQGEVLGHAWKEATCETPKTCTACELTQGTALGHEWKSATCTTPKTCSVCDTTTGSSLGHNWENATCTSPKTCSVCDTTTGSSLGHSWENATCTSPKTCRKCSLEEGSALGHTYSETILTSATSISDGTKRLTCSVCSASHTESYKAPILSSEEVYELAERSVGEILVYNKNGTPFALGTVFVISSDGRLLTNYHVIEDGYSAVVTLNGEEYYVEQILAYDKDIDLAVLKIDAANLTALTLMKSGVKGGATVYAVGSSEGFTLSFSTGLVASPNREIEGVHYIQHEAAISSGNSGGPLFNAYGEVIGINTLTYIEGQNLNFAIAAEEVDNLVYGTPLTFAEYYEKECNVLKKLANYAMTYGTWDVDGYYYLFLGSTVTDDYTTYSRGLFYDPDTGEFTIAILWNSDYFLTITFDEIGTIYEWEAEFTYGYSEYYIGGNLYVSTFNTNTSALAYSYTNAYSSLVSSMREMAAILAKLLVVHLNTDLADAGITAEDLGFVNF